MQLAEIPFFSFKRTDVSSRDLLRDHSTSTLASLACYKSSVGWFIVCSFIII